MKRTHVAPSQANSSLGWLKRFGMGGFLFFFVKGLLWLLVPAGLAMFGLGEVFNG